MRVVIADSGEEKTVADFDIAYGETEINEGGYADDPVDKGRESHRGISRRFNGDWEGWAIIDQIKRDHPEDFKRRIDENSELVELSKSLFRDRYWIPIRGDEIPNQHLANKVFDTGVNQGVARSTIYLQEGLNLLNQNEKSYSDIAVDGKLGPLTLGAIKQFLELENDEPDHLLKVLNLLQGAFYIKLMKRDPTQEKFARGWLNRVNLR